MLTSHDYQHEDTGDFETIEQENHINLAILTQELDDLCRRVQAGEGQPMKALHQIECELQKLSIALHPSAPPETLNDVLQQYMETFYVLPKSRQTLQTPYFRIYLPSMVIIPHS